MLTTEQLNTLVGILLEADEITGVTEGNLDYGERRAEDAKDYANEAMDYADSASASASEAQDNAEEAIEEVQNAKENLRCLKEKLQSAQEILKEAKETKDDLEKTIEVLGTIKDLFNLLPMAVFRETLKAQDRAFTKRTGIDLDHPFKEPENTEEVSDLTSDDLDDLESDESEDC